MRVAVKVFESGLRSWNDLCTEAAEFATTVGKDRLVAISHSEDDNQGVVTVWYWTD